MSIPIVGKCFETTAQFLDYLDDLKFGAWRPRFVTVHHTGAPTLANWHSWQTRANPVSDPQWMRNLASYYGGLGWSAGPHFFVTPKHICVLSPPERRGVHAVSFNATSWGVECVGDFDREPFAGAIRERLIDALAAMHVAAGLHPAPYERGIRGLHFHRDDPKTSKTCPGRNVDKADLGLAVVAKMATLTGGEHEDEQVIPVANVKVQRGKVTASDGLNLRAEASGKAPVLTLLIKSTVVAIDREAMNGSTKWLHVTVQDEARRTGWVAARFVELI